MKCYLAGAMRNVELFNFPAFEKYTKKLRNLGWDVFSPAEHDLSEGFDPSKDQAKELKYYMKTDLAEVCKSDAVFVIPGWETSKGACLEIHVARECGIPVICAETMEEIEDYRSVDDIMEELEALDCSAEKEKRVVNEKTGGEKGQKIYQYSLLPWEVIHEDAKLYGYGSGKYAPRNWERGYKWSLSVDALGRHLSAFMRGESIDPESGCHHLSAVRFHCAALMHFEKYHPELDDIHAKHEDIRNGVLKESVDEDNYVPRGVRAMEQEVDKW